MLKKLANNNRVSSPLLDILNAVDEFHQFVIRHVDLSCDLVLQMLFFQLNQSLDHLRVVNLDSVVEVDQLGEEFVLYDAKQDVLHPEVIFIAVRRSAVDDGRVKHATFEDKELRLVLVAELL